MAPAVAATVAPAALNFAGKHPIISVIGLLSPILIPCCCVSSFISFIAFLCSKLKDYIEGDDESS